MNVDEIYQDILALPEPVQAQVRDFVGYLKEKYATKYPPSSTDAVLPRPVKVKVSRPQLEEILTDDTFWALISLLDYDKRESEEVTAPLIGALSKRSDQIIFSFQDILSEKLSLLDGPAYFEAAPGSSDSFLYARCCVVANGQVFYENVLKNPTAFPDDLHFNFEPLLYVAEDAYELKNGKELQRVPAYNYESFFNENAWGDKTIKL